MCQKKYKPKELKKTIHEIMNLFEEESVVQFFDHCHILHNPVPAKMWQPKGKKEHVLSNSISFKVKGELSNQKICNNLDILF